MAYILPWNKSIIIMKRNSVYGQEIKSYPQNQNKILVSYYRAVFSFIKQLCHACKRKLKVVYNIIQTKLRNNIYCKNPKNSDT